MKLRPRKSKYLSFILILASLTVLAFGVFTLTGPVPDDLRISEPGNSGSADTLVKKKPLLTDTAFSNLLQRADILLRANKLEACLVELEKAQKLKPTDKSVNSRIVQVRGSIADSKKKQIDLSMKALEEPVEVVEDESDDKVPTAMELALRHALQGTDMAVELEAAHKASRQPRREKRGGSDKRRQQQEEILSRTLRNRVK